MDDYKFMAAVDYVMHGDFSNAADIFEGVADPAMVKQVSEMITVDGSVPHVGVCADLIATLSEARGDYIEAKDEAAMMIALFVAIAKKVSEC